MTELHKNLRTGEVARIEEMKDLQNMDILEEEREQRIAEEKEAVEVENQREEEPLDDTVV